MESIIAENIKELLLANNVLPDHQHGFIKGRSTTTNLLHCVNDWSKALDNKIPTDVIYLDFAKAFDKVPRRRLIHKLDHVGIRGNLQRWIDAFLSDRSFLVKVGQSYSQPQLALSGVPQGSVLGPLLFLIYISDIPYHINCNASFFADDTKIYANPSSHYHLLQNDLTSIASWCSDWLLTLNIDKCVVLHIGKNNPNMIYRLDNHVLKTVNSHNDLGVIIDSNLCWSDHILSVCNRANRMSFLLKKSFSSVSFTTFIHLFKSYVRPLLEYGGVVWCPDLVRDQNRLERVQQVATRLPFGRTRPTYAERLNMAKLTNFQQRRIRGDLITTYRILHNDFGSSLRNLFLLNTDSRLRGHPLKLKKENFLTRQRQSFLTNRVFSTWNNLPEDIACAPSVNAFKNRLDALLS